MTGQQLKNSILQLAIEGKLVSQNPNDEPASVLLQRIREDKQRLVKEGKLKKKDLTTTPITEEEKPFDIPVSWEWCRLGEICSRFSTGPFGSNVHKEDYTNNGGTPMVNPTNIKNGQIVLDGIKCVNSAKARELSAYTLTEGDVVLARRGDLSKCAVVNSAENGFLAGTGAFFLHIVEIYLPFFKLIYGAPYTQSYLLSESRGDTMNNLNQKLLGALPFPLPPLSEQRRIVARIEELMPLVDAYGKSQEELEALNAGLPEALKKSILQEAIQGRLVPQDDKDEPASVLLARIRKEKEQLVKAGKLKKKDLITTPFTEEEKFFDIPESWAWVNLPQIGLSQLGKTKNPNQKDGALLPYLCSINVYWEGIKLDILKEMLFNDADKEKYSLEFNDLLICEGGDCGRSAIWKEHKTAYYQNALHRVRLYGDISVEYIRYCMFLYHQAGWLDNLKKGETIQHLVKAKLDCIPFPLPPLAEQRRIVAKIEELFAILQAK